MQPGLFSCICLLTLVSSAFGAAQKTSLLYSRRFNAPGEKRYLADGTFKEIIDKARTEFNVEVHDRPLDKATLKGVDVILIANPSDKPFATNSAPHHFDANDVKVLTDFVKAGGGLIVMSNQENHNLDTDDTNLLLRNFGMQFTNLYTDAKKLILPSDAPVIGGLRWAYYTGNLVTLDPKHPAKPRALALNDLSQKPPKGTRDQEGALMAAAELGKGRVIAITDSGWLTNDALSEKGIGPVAIHGHDNWEIFRRLVTWAAHH